MLVSFVNRRDLGTRENICAIRQQSESLPGISGKRDNVSHMNTTKLFGELKCFLANRDNIFPWPLHTNRARECRNEMLLLRFRRINLDSQTFSFVFVFTGSNKTVCNGTR